MRARGRWVVRCVADDLSSCTCQKGALARVSTVLASSETRLTFLEACVRLLPRVDTRFRSSDVLGAIRGWGHGRCLRVADAGKATVAAEMEGPCIPVRAASSGANA